MITYKCEGSSQHSTAELKLGQLAPTLLCDNPKLSWHNLLQGNAQACYVKQAPREQAPRDKWLFKPSPQMVTQWHLINCQWPCSWDHHEESQPLVQTW